MDETLEFILLFDWSHPNTSFVEVNETLFSEYLYRMAVYEGFISLVVLNAV